MIHGDLLGERARLTPGKTAVVLAASGQRLSYGELDDRATAVARVLRTSLSAAKGDRVALLAGNRVEFLDLFFAAGKSGVVLVPLSTRLTPRELSPILEHAGARLLVYDGACLETVKALKGLATVDHWVALDAGARADAADPFLDDLLAALPGTPWARERCGPEDLYCLLYTSGTTGKPKGVMLPHRMLAWNGLNTACCWQLREDDVSPVFTPLYHAGGLGAFLVPIIAIGGTLVLHAGFDAGEVWRTIEREGCTVVLGVPTIFQLLMQAPEFETADLSRVRWFISGGAPLPRFLIEAYRHRGVVLKQGYGLTEVGVNCFAMTAEESLRKAGSIGKPLMFTEARLAREDGSQAEPGEVAELLLRGPHVCAGYWRDPQATAAALDADGFFHTGDLARSDEEGFFSIAGRKKDMLISGGVNVYPAEVEGELLLHAAVQDAAVVGIPHPTWGEVGVAFVVTRPGHPLTASDLEAFLGQTLARYKVPKEFRFVEELPRTPYGKILKAELRQRHLTARDAGPLPRPVLAHAVDGAGPPLLLLNGGLMSMGAWQEYVPRLAKTYRVVRCDFRGQLLTPGPPPPLEGHARDLAELLDHLSIDTAHLVGTSFGGEVGLLFAALHPARVRSLTAVTATDRTRPHALAASQALIQACHETAQAGDGGRVFDLLVRQTFSPEYLTTHGDLLGRRRAQIASLPATWFEGLAGLLASLEGLDLRPWLGRIRCPALVVAAEKDRTFPVEEAESLASGIAGARLTVVPGAGHGLVIEAPDRLIEILSGFLDGLAPERKGRS